MASSLAATAATLGFGWLMSKRVRGWVLAALARLSGLGVLRIHRHQDDAKGELAEELRRARSVRVMVGRGNELTRDGFAPLWSGGGRTPESTRVLLPDPYVPEEGESWLDRRERELGVTDPGFRRGVLRDQVLANHRYLLEATAAQDSTEIRFYDLPNLYRIVVTENLVFLTLYRKAVHGRRSPCIVAGQSGWLYEFALRVFDTAWEASRSPDGAPASHTDRPPPPVGPAAPVQERSPARDLPPHEHSHHSLAPRNRVGPDPRDLL
ncbi:hypothetical protein [Nocardiopsis valliformis]|uniref:hypothetical protein n=1 Tax=Nocardiopsis valliformis TaxID=239974 RepID=UPI00034D1074|nr:hypothetical protein [Nocardiopsis valliformis]